MYRVVNSCLEDGLIYLIFVIVLVLRACGYCLRPRAHWIVCTEGPQLLLTLIGPSLKGGESTEENGKLLSF